MKQKLMKRFYEVLVLLRVLGQVQGDKLPGQMFEDTNMHSLEIVELRRKVMYHLCVMCDFLKGGDSVTAIAMEKLPSGPRYWMAANGNLPKIKRFLRETLEMLNIEGLATIEYSSFEQRLFQKFVRFQRSRIKEYWKLLQPCIAKELNKIQLSPLSENSATGYAEWLQEFQRSLDDVQSMCKLSRFTYDTRRSEFLRASYDPVSQSPTTMENDARIKIRHYVGRLGATSRAAKVLAHAAINQFNLFNEFTLEVQRSGASCERPTSYRGLTLPGISGRMFSGDPTTLQNFRQAIMRLDDQGSMMSRVTYEYQKKDWKPRIHAELQLLEGLSYADCVFYDDDKYVACSKAACFCCFHYICEHPGSFSRPPCHNKVYLNWSPPDLGRVSDERHQQQHVIMTSVTKHIRQAVIQKVLNADRGMKWHPDSSTGITPSVVQDIESFQVSGSGPGTPERLSSPSSLVDSNDADSEDGGVAIPEDTSY